MKTQGFYILSAILFSSLSSCQNKSNEVRSSDIKAEKNNPECESLFNKYIEKASNMEKDSAVYFLDKSILCDPKNIDYKYSKAQFFVQEKQYVQAISELDKIQANKIDPSIDLYKATLKLKIEDSRAQTMLKAVYDEMQRIKELSASNYFYKIALDNYFKGSDFAMKQIANYKTIYTTDYETQNIQALESLIKKNSKEKVLFLCFNIK